MWKIKLKNISGHITVFMYWSFGTVSNASTAETDLTPFLYKTTVYRFLNGARNSIPFVFLVEYNFKKTLLFVLDKFLNDLEELLKDSQV